jgi:hypothetical protein
MHFTAILNVKTTRMMMNCLMAIATVSGGCSSGVVRDQVLESSAPDPLAAARSILREYANGAPLASEAIDFDEVVAGVSTVDADKGKRLKAFFDKTLATSRPNVSQAKKLLADFE